jgi:hypothetical protein
MIRQIFSVFSIAYGILEEKRSRQAWSLPSLTIVLALVFGGGLVAIGASAGPASAQESCYQDEWGWWNCTSDEIVVEGERIRGSGGPGPQLLAIRL